MRLLRTLSCLLSPHMGCEWRVHIQVPSTPYPSLSFTAGTSTPPPSAYASPSVAAPADRPIGQDGSSHGAHGARLDLDDPDPIFLCPITQVCPLFKPCITTL